MKAIKLTAEQVRDLKGKCFAPFMSFNVISINGNDYLFLSEQDEKLLINTEYSYLTDLEKVDVDENMDKPSYEN